MLTPTYSTLLILFHLRITQHDFHSKETSIFPLSMQDLTKHMAPLLTKAKLQLIWIL